MSGADHAYPLIQNKVTSPHYVTPILRRARLLDWLQSVSGCRAIVVAAYAGYGKTTLLWQWEQEVSFPCYWYKLDRNDRDWSLHISYLIESIKQGHPTFGQRALSMLEQLGGPGSSRPGVAAYLLAEMHEVLTEPCTFIIDDWHVVASVTEVRGLWNQILRDAPPTCRFVFLSRAKPRLQFARFKTHGGYAEIRTDSLRFTDGEIDELFRDIYNDPLDPMDLAEVDRRTEGWAASLQLVEVAIRDRIDQDERRSFIESITADSEADLVEYLAQEVLDQQPAEVRNFLLSTAVLTQIDPTLAARLAGLADGSAVLERLENGGLFTYRTDSRGVGTFRYHGLFRDFLLRRLTAERTNGEVAALHIHAASYFETNALWPEAIHHYLEAGLQPQAARLIAKHGEDLVSSGRLPLLEGWLAALPSRSVKENARLSLLAGELAGVRGDWTSALGLLSRSRTYFARKGDRRLEALACSKISTFYNNLGDVTHSASAAHEGLALAPVDAFATRIRLRGNLAVTTTWLESLETAEMECRRLADESHDRGYEQFAAIAYHNLGMILRDAGRLDESLVCLTRAEAHWDASPANPYADASELVLTLLALGDDGRASIVAEGAVRRTRPWLKPNCEAQYGLAAVLAYKGEHVRSARILRSIFEGHGDAMGPVAERVVSLLIECLYLEGGSSSQLKALSEQLGNLRRDPRLEPATSVATAMAAHRDGSCRGECSRATQVLARWRANGATYLASSGEFALSILSIDHDAPTGIARVTRTLRETPGSFSRGQFKWWCRRLEPHLRSSLEILRSPDLLLALLEVEPRYWLRPVCQLVTALRPTQRAAVLQAISQHADERTADLVRSIDGADVQGLRRELVHRFAKPLLIRTFGSLAIHRGEWTSAEIPIGRRRTRLLLGLLVSNLESGLTRDQVIDHLWPDSDPGAAVNSLNQTVFQLRRLFEPGYREGDHPQYLISTVDSVQLNRDLVRTDLGEIRGLSRSLEDPQDLASRVVIARDLIDFVRGEYLADLKYEDWAATSQLSVHAEVRRALLPIAQGRMIGATDDWALRAGCALAALDPFDETAHVAMVRHLAATGRRMQAKSLAGEFSNRLRRELDEEPSDELRMAVAPVRMS